MKELLTSWWAAEPVLVSFVGTAVVYVPALFLLLREFGVSPLTTGQEAAILSILGLIAGTGTVVARSQVSSPHTVGKLVDTIEAQRSAVEHLTARVELQQEVIQQQKGTV